MNIIITLPAENNIAKFNVMLIAEMIKNLSMNEETKKKVLLEIINVLS